MRLLLALLASLLLAACASAPDPVVATAGAKLWYSVDNRVGLTPDELEALTQRLDADLAGVRAPPGAAGANHLRITLTSFRMIDESRRPVEGLVAGSDHVASVVQVIAPGTQVLDEKRVLTRAGGSIDTSAALLREHGGEIARYALGQD